MMDRPKRSGYNSPKSIVSNGDDNVKIGSIILHKDRARHAVSWWCGFDKRTYVITRYKNQFMPCNQFDHNHKKCMDPLRCDGFKTAIKLLSAIQSRLEEHFNGICQFRIEEFTGKNHTDILEYYEKWMHNYIEKKRKPATVSGYWSYYKNWIKPYFKKHPVMLHEIRATTLNNLLNYIKEGLKNKNPSGNTGKTAQNIIYALHTMMDYALRDERILRIPPFPKEEDYNIIQTIPEWLNIKDFWEVINMIPQEHKPVFLWMYFHLMREAEACALQWDDWDDINKVFWVRRSISARKLVESTKTSQIYATPCHRDFYPYMLLLKRSNGGLKSKFIFTNSRARKPGKRYTNESINNIWKKACKEAGKSIRPYAGIRHSRASQMHNELGMSLPEIKEAGTWKRLDSVQKYAVTEFRRKRELLERNLEQTGPDYYKTHTDEK